MAVYPGIIPGWPGYLGIPGFLDKGGRYGRKSWDNPGMARLLGNPVILGQDRLLGNPVILGQERGHTAVHPRIIPGWLGYLGIPGYLGKRGGIRLSILG